MPTETIEVPEDLRGYIIGGKGWQIREIRQTSNAKVQINQTGFCVTGTEEQIQVAKGMIESIMYARQVCKAANKVSKEIQVPLYMKRFMYRDNKGRQRFKEIREKTVIESITKDVFRLTGIQQEHIQAAEDMINELKISIEESLMCVNLEKVPEYRKIIPLVIGKGEETVIEIQEETQTYIQVDEPYLKIQGENKEQQHKAKLKIKEIVANHLKMKKFEKYQTISFVDDWFVNDDSNEFSLRRVDNPPSRWFGCHYKIVGTTKVDESKKKTIDGLESLYEKIHQKLTKLEERDDRENFQVDFWCHYGNVYVKNVDEAQEGLKYSAQEINKNITGVDAWKTAFDGGLKQLNVDKLVEVFSSEKEDAVPPYRRYEFSVISPSCKRFTIKVNLRNENGELKFSGLDPGTAQECPYNIGTPTIQHMKVHVIILNTKIDCCLVIQTKFKKDSYTPEEEKELEVLKEFLDKRLKLKNGTFDLIKPNEFPEDYDLNFWRMSERRIVKDDGFTITVSKEESENLDGFELRKNVVYKNDVQIHLNHSNIKLSKRQGDQTTENDVQGLNKEQTRKYVKKVLSFVEKVQDFFSGDQDPDEDQC